jgi:hypothetical protein
MTLMPTRARRSYGAAFLALLIAASFLTTGGWFCADGRACLPALAPTCCCGEEAKHGVAAGEERCDSESDATCLTPGDCGCYQDLASVATALRAGRFVVAAPAALPPHPALAALLPSSGRLPPTRAADPFPPPRFLATPRDTRAPPAA